MNDFEYGDLRFIFEQAIPWEKIREARGEEEDYTQEYLMTLDNGANFSKKEVAPRAGDVDDRECCLASDGNGGKSVQLPKGMMENLEGLKGMGALSGLTFPEEVGGLNFPLTVFFGLGELFSMGDSSLGLTPMLQEGVGQVLIEFAGRKVVEDYLPKLMSGERICSMGLTEPGAGSDLASMKTLARPVNGEGSGSVYLLNGTKTFITNGFGDVLALAGTEEGISMFLVMAEDKEVSRIEKKLGIRGSPTCELLFENSPGILIGEPGMGLVPNMLKLMHFARLGVASQALGIGQRAHTLAKRYATYDRVQFGVPIAEHAPVRQILFENEIELQATRALTYLACQSFDLKEATRKKAGNLDPEGSPNPGIRKDLTKHTRLVDLLIPLCKYDAAELCNRVTYSSLQVFGGYGFTREYPMERLYRDARITSIYEGTSQIQLREVFNEAYYLEKIGLMNQFKLGDGERFVETERNRLFVETLFDEQEEKILSMEGSESSTQGLLSGIREMRDCLQVSREELFLQEQGRSKEAARKYHGLYYKDYVDLLASILKAYLLTGQGLWASHKQRVARAYVERSILAAEHVKGRIKRGLDDLITDDYDAIM